MKQAISIFGDKEAGGIVLLKTFDQYYFGYDDFKGYQSLVNELQEHYPLGQELISEKTIGKILDYYFEPSTHRMEDIDAILIQFQLRFNELVGQERLMAYLYEDIMKYFKETKYAVP